MSVLIKGMEMPETCEKCRMNVAMFLFPDGPIGHCMLLKGRADKRKCPLVPVPTPHGRLIDEDALMDALHEKFDDEEAHAFETGAFWHHKSVIEVINDAPTIIEAEGET